ncbi:uncharacterized protein LOC131162645 [Malania oleifera]|uniref:uncharacterized protein LOC131162645 n=1 Tax=Malania oleifera TaxID=397392 RepID=UPI0025AE5B56|nr:uncharacterized protein LOC131162645 [Malania oleifera]
MGQLDTSLSRRDEGKLPSQSLVNPKGQYRVECELVAGPSSYHKQPQAMTILRSGGEVNNRPKERLDQEKGSEKMAEESNAKLSNPSFSNIVIDTTIPTPSNDGALPHYVPTVPYPTTLHVPSKSKKETNTESIMDTFRQVKVNIPLLDAIKQVPTYTKFLKDLCTRKRKSRVHINKQVRLAENVSSILFGHIHPKQKNFCVATNSYAINDYTINRALLDLGASVNLLPYSIFKQFNLRELKPTLVTLSFTNRLVKRPQGVIEEILVKFEEFYYLADFIVLDMEPTDLTKDPIPVLLR